MPYRALFVAILAFPLTAQAEFGLGAKVGSAGAGIEGMYYFDDQFVLRASLNSYTYSGDRNVSGIDYDYDLKLQSASLLLDIFPKGKRFYFTGGLFVNGNVFEADAIVVNSISIGRNDYTAAQLGDFGGEVEFQPLSPYLGLGWRWRNNQPGFSLGVEAGLLFHGQGDVTLNATGPVAGTPAFVSDVEREVDEIEDQLGIAKIWPVVEARFAYRF